MMGIVRAAAVLVIFSIWLSPNVFAAGITWVDQDPRSAGLDVYYDFRPTVMGQANWMTSQEQNLARTSLQMWSQVSHVHFIQNPWAPETSILNIGVTPMDGRLNVLGRGGYSYTNAGGFWHISSGVAALDATENWDLRVGNGNVPGTVDFFTVMSHEIGHALGLDHSSSPNDVMYPYYMGARDWLSSGDIQNIQSLYGGSVGAPNQGFAALAAVPEPGTAGLMLVASALACLIKLKRRGRVTAPSSSRR
jgi:hypothetical protein